MDDVPLHLYLNALRHVKLCKQSSSEDMLFCAELSISVRKEEINFSPY